MGFLYKKTGMEATIAATAVMGRTVHAFPLLRAPSSQQHVVKLCGYGGRNRYHRLAASLLPSSVDPSADDEKVYDCEVLVDGDITGNQKLPNGWPNGMPTPNGNYIENLIVHYHPVVFNDPMLNGAYDSLGDGSGEFIDGFIKSDPAIFAEDYNAGEFEHRRDEYGLGDMYNHGPPMGCDECGRVFLDYEQQQPHQEYYESQGYDPRSCYYDEAHNYCDNYYGEREEPFHSYAPNKPPPPSCDQSHFALLKRFFVVEEEHNNFRREVGRDVGHYQQNKDSYRDAYARSTVARQRSSSSYSDRSFSFTPFPPHGAGCQEFDFSGRRAVRSSDDSGARGGGGGGLQP